LFLFSRIFRCVIPNVRDGKISPPPVNFSKNYLCVLMFRKIIYFKGIKSVCFNLERKCLK
jgi:hypothetical protein